MEENSYGKEYQHSTYNKYNIGTRLAYEINKNMNIRVDFSYWLAKDIENNGNFWASYPGQLQNIDRWSESLTFEAKTGKHQFRLSPHFSSENNLYYSDLSDTAYKNQKSTLQTYGFILQDAIDLGIFNLILGADNLSRKNTSTIWSAPEVETVPYQPDYLNMSTGAYFQLNVVLLDQKLNASLGGRYDYIKFKLFETDLLENQAAEEVYQTFNPNFGIQYTFLNGFKAHAAAGTAFVAPDAFKMAGSYTTNFGSYKGNPDLEPESSFTYDFGLGYADKKSGLEADISYFSTIYENIIGYDFSDLAFTSFKNEDNANMSGLELEAEYDFGALNNFKYHLKFYASFTYLLNTTVKVDSLNLDMKYVRKGKGSFGLDFSSKKGISARLNARYIGERYEDNWLYSLDWNTWERIPFVDSNGQEIRPSLYNEDIIKMPDHLVFDLSFSYLIKKKYQIGFSVDNLLDENYSEKDMYYMPGRSLIGFLNFKF
jgi:outer membrane receptor protein involved in Fe transport